MVPVTSCFRGIVVSTIYLVTAVVTLVTVPRTTVAVVEAATSNEVGYPAPKSMVVGDPRTDFGKMTLTGATAVTVF